MRTAGGSTNLLPVLGAIDGGSVRDFAKRKDRGPIISTLGPTGPELIEAPPPRGRNPLFHGSETRLGLKMRFFCFESWTAPPFHLHSNEEARCIESTEGFGTIQILMPLGMIRPAGKEASGFGKRSCPISLAPRAGFEPATNRLTADRSATELPGKVILGSRTEVAFYLAGKSNVNFKKIIIETQFDQG